MGHPPHLRHGLGVGAVTQHVARVQAGHLDQVVVVLRRIRVEPRVVFLGLFGGAQI